MINVKLNQIKNIINYLKMAFDMRDAQAFDVHQLKN